MKILPQTYNLRNKSLVKKQRNIFLVVWVGSQEMVEVVVGIAEE